MKERPSIFSAPMVRALLAGQKTQTRREAKDLIGFTATGQPIKVSSDGFPCEYICPHGQPGDRLWVREATHRRPMLNLLTGQPLAPEYDGGAYTADGADVLSPAGFDVAWWYSRKICPALHMPRSASRITLEITGIRVERLQDISEADAEAEGASYAVSTDAGFEEHPLGTRREGFAAMWQKINGAGSWDANPWVWVVEFQPIEGGAA